LSILDFKVSSAELGSGVSSVIVGGEVDLSTAPELKEVLNGVVDGGARFVLVDLSAATFIDSTTLGVLMGAVKRLRPAGGELAIACNDPNIRKIFEITLLDRVFAIFDTPEEGAQHLRRGASEGSQRPIPAA
jgi:anti-sigma B factor antagonist